MNIENTLNNAVKILNKSKIKNSILDSEILLSQAINRDRKYIFLNSKENLKQKYSKNFNNLIARRRKGEPIAYLINKKEFWKQSFYVDQNVLIPRPDTELIIEQVLKLFLKNYKLQILDIGTGSGCILLSLLKEMPNCYGIGIDISKKSINISKYNAKMLQLTNKVKFYQSDVDNFKIGKYDLIVSEIRKVIDKATVLIKKNGKLVLEIGFNQKNKVQEMLRKKGFYINKTLKDYGKKDRCIISTKI